jgi:PTH1 family peptidyl-tRNA hydrolase
LHLVVGLGNPGSRYASTRHNIGFMVVDRLAQEGRRAWSSDQETRSQLALVELAGSEALLVKPQTYMNNSGEAIRALHLRLGFEPGEILVVMDDFLLDFGCLRLRRKGSDGGHNGLASVIEKMRSQDIPRLRMGLGSPAPGQDSIDYVLAPFGEDEAVEELVERGCRAVESFVEEGIDTAMNRFNSC